MHYEKKTRSARFLESTLCAVLINPLITKQIRGQRFWEVIFFIEMRIHSGIQITRHFIKSVVVETKQFVGSDVNVIWTRQTCGQRSSMAAGSKHRALAYYFSIRICYIFLTSKCRRESELGLCTSLVVAIFFQFKSVY